MSWEEDLRHLDADLAAGRLTVDEHRRRTDDLLARESSVSPRIPLRARPKPAEAQPAEEENVPVPLAAPRTRPAPAPRTPAPDVPSQPTAPTRYGQQVFAPTLTAKPVRVDARDRAGKSSSRLTSVLVFLLVMALGGVGLWWLDTHRPTTVGRPAPTVAPADAASVLARLSTLPGTPLASSTTVPTGNGVGLGAYPMSEVDVLTRSGTNQLVLRSTEQDNQNFAVLAIRSADPAGTLRVVAQYQHQLGLAAADSAALPAEVTALGANLAGQSVFRALYNSGSWTIVAQASSPTNAVGNGTLAEGFNRMVRSIVTALPPG